MKLFNQLPAPRLKLSLEVKDYAIAISFDPLMSGSTQPTPVYQGSILQPLSMSFLCFQKKYSPFGKNLIFEN